MRIIHDFHGKKPTTTGSGRAYSGGCSKPFVWQGFRAELLACDGDGTGEEGDALYLEGDGESIRKVLTQLLEILDTVEGLERKRVDDLVARQVQCPTCQTWVDPKHESHGDGKGNACTLPKHVREQEWEG